jgi:hypothetical protein
MDKSSGVFRSLQFLSFTAIFPTLSTSFPQQWQSFPQGISEFSTGFYGGTGARGVFWGICRWAIAPSEKWYFNEVL